MKTNYIFALVCTLLITTHNQPMGIALSCLGCITLYTCAIKYCVTPKNLLDAAKSGDYALAQDLLELRYPLNDQDNLGNTPLHWAAFREDRNMVQLLIAHNANPLVKNSVGKKAIDRSGTPDIQELLSNHEQMYRLTRGQPICVALLKRRISGFPATMPR